MTNSVNLIVNGFVMGVLLGIDHLSLKAACLGKRFALSVEETLATAQISTLLWEVLKMQENTMNTILSIIIFLGGVK